VKGERIAGTVVSDSDGHPLAHARLTLTRSRVQEVVGTTTADEDGRFAFEAVTPGKYELEGAAPHYLPTYYMQHENYWTAIVTGAGVRTEGLVLRLVPASSISGRVVDESEEPVVGATIVLYRNDPTAAQPVTQVRNEIADERGEFEFRGLARGRYYVAASASPWYAVHPVGMGPDAEASYRTAIDPALDVAYATTFYPDATDAEGASVLTIGGGEQLQADIHLRAQHALTLTLRVPEGQKPGEQNVMLSEDVFGTPNIVRRSNMDMLDGALRIGGLAPGKYNINEVVGGRGVMPTGAVDLTNASATLDMPKPEAATITVTVHSEGSVPLPAGLQIALQSVGTRSGGASEVSDKGVAVIAGLPLGEYKFLAYGQGRLLGVMGIRADGQRLPGSRLTVAHDAAVDLTVTTTAVDVEGFAKRDGAAAAGSMMVLVPAGADTSEELFRRDQSDLDGSFRFIGVVPGNYIAVAIDDGWPLRWTDIQTMTPYLMKGVPVSVRVAEKSGVHLAQAVNTQAR
jgi:protocatechuate 3,4-dioxygenase beta subunit